MRRFLVTTLCAIGLGAVSAPASSSVLNAQAGNDRFTATIELPGGVSAELTVRFENAVGLDVSSLGVSVQQVNPVSLSLLSRLPGLTGFSIPAGFPVLIQISPPAGSGFAFEGVAEIELYTRNLQYTAGTPLRLYSAPSGGTFRDITDSVSGGSYRPRGSTGHFSDFLIVADTRLPGSVIADKFNRLGAALQTHGPAIASTARVQLEQLYATAVSQWNGGDVAGAADTVAAFESAVAAAAAAGQVPRVWRSSRDLDNVDGILRADARTLRFSLNRASNQL